MRLTPVIAAVALLLIWAADPALADSREATAVELSQAYIRTWTSNGSAAIADVTATYAPEVRFYGRVLNHEQLRAEKRRFLERWPVRRYALRPGTVRAACEGHLCRVRALLDWLAEDPRRSAVSRGVSSFEQTFMLVPGTRPAVIEETGKVLARRG